MNLQKKIIQHNFAIQSIKEENIINIAKYLQSVICLNKKIFICGNGGSAADAQHIATEFVVKFKQWRTALPVIALTTDTSILTAIGNDLDFKFIFARQIEALGQEDDALISLTTSGASENIINAIEVAKQRYLYTLSFTGNHEFNPVKNKSSCTIVINSTETAHIQETYMFMWHLIIEALEEML